MSHISISVRSLRIKSFPRKPPKCTAFLAFPSSSPPHTTLLVFPLSTSYTHPEIATSSGTSFDFFRYSTSSTTALSRSGNARKLGTFSLSSATALSLHHPHSQLTSSPIHCSQPRGRENTNPRLFLTTATASLCSNVNIPHPVCLTSTISLVASSCWLMTMERSASAAEPPAYSLQNARQHRHPVSGDRQALTLRMTWASPSSMPNALAGSMRASMHVTTRYFLAGGRARWPLSKLAAYSAEAASTLFWMADILGVVVKARRWKVLSRPRRMVGAGRWFRRRVCWRMLVVVGSTVF